MGIFRAFVGRWGEVGRVEGRKATGKVELESGKEPRVDRVSGYLRESGRI